MDEYSTIPIDLERAGIRGADDGRAAALVVLRGPELGRRFPLGPGAVTIGRLPDLPISIHDQSLSRKHCEVGPRQVEGRRRYVLVDLGSTNGTYLNGRRVEQAPLQAGDRLTLGDVVLKFVLLDTIEEDFHHEVADRIRTDRGTGLLNLSTFYEELDKALARARGGDILVTALMVDVDGLKQVNDAQGHLVGSEVIRQVAECLRAACAPVHGVAALYGGDEFTAFLVGFSEAEAIEVADGLRTDVATRRVEGADNTQVQVTVSVGVAEFPRDATVREVLIRRADLALYAAKKAGRNRVVPFRQHLEDDAT